MDEKQLSPSDIEQQKEADLFDLFKALWTGRLTITLTVLIGIVGTVIYLHLATYEYEISMKMIPTQTEGSNDLTSSLGGLASLAGLSGGANKNSPFDLYLEAIYARETAEELSKNGNFLQKIYRRDWNEEKGVWQDNRGIKTLVVSTVKQILGAPPLEWVEPGAAHLQSFILGEVIITEFANKPTTKIAIFHPDPDFGVKFLTSLNRTVDGQIRKRALERADQYIKYLSSKITTTNVTEYRQALIDNLAEQEKLKMAASATTPFAADPFEAPISSLGPTNPSVTKSLAIGIGLGFFVGLLLVLRKSTILFRSMIN